MGKYLVKPILKEQEVLIDTPEGYLRVTAGMNDMTGEGSLILSEAYEYAKPGDDVPSNEEQVPLAKVRITSKERALTIARVLVELASKMREWEDDNEDCDKDCVDCDTCEHREVCLSEDEEDDDNG